MQQSITQYDVLSAIKTSWTYLSEKGYELTARRGFYGKNLDESVARLAAKLSAPVSRVRVLVTQLLNERKVEFVTNRLMASKRGTAVSRDSIRFITPMSLPQLASMEIDDSTSDGIPPEKSYLRMAWFDEFQQVGAAIIA